MSNQAMQTPLVEMLRAIPQNHCVDIGTAWTEGGFEIASSHIPVGRHMHDAAARIAALEAENARARKLLGEARLALSILPNEYRSAYTMKLAADIAAFLAGKP